MDWRVTDRFRGREGVWEERNDDLRDGVGVLARSECESSTRKRRSNATTTLSRAPTTRSLRVFIYTYVHARPSYNSFFLSHPLSDTLWPVSNLFSLFDSKIVSFEKSREKLDGFDRWFSSFFFFFRFLEFSSRTKATGRVDEGGERLNSMNKTRDQSSSSGMECEISILFFSRTRRRIIIIIILILIPPSLLECIIFLEKRRIRIWNLEFSRLDRDLFIARRGGEESGEGKGWMKIWTARKTHLHREPVLR